jgi:hypothetical protein
LKVDGTEKIAYKKSGHISDSFNIGKDVGNILKRKIGKDFF